MAVVAFLNGGNLTTANNANAVLAHNLGVSGNAIQLANTRLIPFTPTAGTLTGVVLAIDWVGQAGATITAKLQFFNGSTWADVAGATRTLNGSQITSGLVDALPLNNTSGQFIKYFEFTTPAIVTAVANTWRIDVTVVAVGGNASLRTSDNTNAFFVAVGQGTSTYANGDTIIVAKQPLNITSNADFNGVLQTGVTRYTSGVLCTSESRLREDTAMLKVSSNVTLNVQGYFYIPSLCSLKVGESTSLASNVNINYVNPASGTLTHTGFSSVGGQIVTTSTINKMSMFLYGTSASNKSTFLVKNISTGATVIEVDDPSGWVANDKIFIGGGTTRGILSDNEYTVQSVSGKAVTLTTPIAVMNRHAGVTVTATLPSTFTTTNKHGLYDDDEVQFTTTGTLPTGLTQYQKYYVIKDGLTPTTFKVSATIGGSALVMSGVGSGTHTLVASKLAGRVIKTNGYGIKLTALNTAGSSMYFGQPTNIKIYGCHFVNLSIFTSGNFGQEQELATDQDAFDLKDCLFQQTQNNTNHQGSWLNSWSLNKKGTKIERCHAVRGGLFGGIGQTAGQAFNFDIKDSINISSGFLSGSSYNVASSTLQCNWENSHFEHANIQYTFSFSASYFNKVRFWGCSTSVGAMRLQGCVDTLFNRMVFDNCANGYSFVNICTGMKSVQDCFGGIIQNTTDINCLASFVGYESEGTHAPIIIDAGNPVTSTILGSIVRFSQINQDLSRNETYSRVGNTTSCGVGQVDTTTRLGSGLSLRIRPLSSLINIEYPLRQIERKVPTGNIQNKTLTIGAWIKINNASFWANTHQKPRLNIKFDNKTIQFAECSATTEWQFISVSVTPQTNYGEVELWFTASTSATGINADFYLDDVSVQYPPATQVNLGSLDLYSNALPIFPPISTGINANDVWATLLIGFADNTAGDIVGKKLLKLKQFLALK